ncbi:hypothetical protein Clacol_000161 [Clathrus columnatus]|uniref:Uncharacterized protein n=1 Tax=Clathrus columnatus TaxID=1419009 RepID=A0AAV4ZYF5_9AGAM|nr:hypothetical protein Clacol_000161 [Clathrus columnatus]
MVKEVLLRSRTLPLDLAIYNHISLFHELQGPDANRVRMLRLGNEVYGSQYSPLSYFTSLFPSLTMLFLEDYYQKIDLSIEPLPLFQAMKVTIRNLGNLALPNNFPNLWWLHLRYELTLPLFPLLKALQNLPRLRVLYLFPLRRWNLPDVPEGFITFHRLEALITGSPILQVITASKLLYLECTGFPENFFTSNKNYSHLCGFDFSKITYIQIKLNCCGREVYIKGKFKVDTSDDDDMTPLKIKNGFKSAFDEITSSYPNEFYIRVANSSATPRSLSLFATIVKKFNNLNEISLNYNQLNPPEWTPQTDQEEIFFLDAVRSATKVRHLTIYGNDFVTFCEYLNDGTLFPNLESLTYSTEKKQDFLDPLLKLMTERSKICPQSLKVELTGFFTVPPEALEPAERLGLWVTQTPQKPCLNYILG